MPVRSASFSPHRPVSPGRSKYSVERSLDDLMNKWTRIARISGEPPSGASLAQVLRSLRDGTISPRIVIEQLASSDAAQYLVMRARTLGGYANTYFSVAVLFPVVTACYCYRYLDDTTNSQEEASTSYKWLFAARQFVVLAAAMIPQSLVTASRLALDQFFGPQQTSSTAPIIWLVGSFLHLLIVVSDEWPLIVFWWSFFDMIFLYGSHPFSHHWLYFQDTFPIFNPSNPSGFLVESEFYFNTLLSAWCLSLSVSFHRLAVRLSVEKRAYQVEGRKLIKVMQSMMAVVELTNLTKTTIKAGTFTNYKIELEKLLERVEPSSLAHDHEDGASIYALFLFRTASALMNRELPVEKPEDIYDGLLALQKEQTDALRIPELLDIEAGNASRQIPKTEFVLTINAAYAAHEEYRQSTCTALQIQNAQPFTHILDIIFCTFHASLVAFLHGMDFASLLACLSAIVVGVSSVFSNTCSEFFVGLIFIIGLDPYRVGDWVELVSSGSGPSDDFNEKITWRVKRVNLFSTEFVNLSTKAESKKSNGDLRVNYQFVNWSRRDATFQILMRVPVGNCDRLLLLKTFHELMKQYANDNPREWPAVNIATADAMAVGSQYYDYRIMLQHRESWQEMELVLASKYKLTNYCENHVVDALHTAFSRNDIKILVL